MIQLPMPKIKEVEAQARALPDCISFSQGALRLGGVDQHVKEYARQMLTLDKADYYDAPLGLLALRKKIAEDLTTEHGARVGIESIAVSHGAVGALTALGLTVLEAGDEVLLPEPAYPVYNNIALFCKAKPVFIKTGSLEQAGSSRYWKFDLASIENAITPATRMIIIANPSNPTGTFLSKKEIARLQNVCEERGIYLVMDEVYDDYIFEGNFVSATNYAVKSPFVVRLGSFSKSFGMSGWRVGYLVGGPALITAMAPVQAATLSCPTVISQYAALYALEHKRDILPGYRAAMQKSRDVACDFFDKLQDRGLIEYVKPPAGFYIFFKTREKDSMPLVTDIMTSAGVAMAPGSDFGESCKPFIRFCFARDVDVVREGVKRLQSYFSSKQIASYKQPTAQSL